MLLRIHSKGMFDFRNGHTVNYACLVVVYFCYATFSVSIDENIYTSGAGVTIPGLTFGCTDADAIDTLSYSLSSGSTSIWDVTTVAGSMQ